MTSIRKQINNYVNNNYDKLYNLALKFTRDDLKARELISTSILAILENKKLEQLRYEYKDNIFIYIYVVMKNECFNQKSRYNKEKIKELTLDTVIFTNYIKEIDILEDIYNWVDSNELESMFDDPIDYWYLKTLWKMYYKPEEEYSIPDINNMSMSDIKSIRKISLRKIQDKTNIDFRSVSSAINIINDKIKTKFKS